MEMGIIEINGLVKRFGPFTALKGIDLTVEQGEVFGFIGPNGAGKSTTIRTIIGVLKPSEGSVSVFGLDAWEEAMAIHRRIAYVPGEMNLWPNLTGGEIIDLLLTMRGSVNRKRRDALIERFAFDPTKKFRNYSKGNRQKVALIAAFASDADLFILDEPTSGLDPLMVRVFQECIHEIKEEGKTVFLSSHILSEVDRLCDRVAIIREGTIIEAGELKTLKHLTAMQYRVRTKKPLVGLEKLPGITDIHEEEGDIVFRVERKQMEHVIAYLNQFGVLFLESTPITLEDLFMRYYEGESQ